MQRGSTLGRTCSVDGCDRKHYGKGYCAMHYSRMTRTGSTEKRDLRRNPVDRFLALVERTAVSDCWHWTGTVNQRGYGMFSPGEREGPKMVSAHRWSYEFFIGPIPDGMQVGHVCHDTSNCDGGNGCPHRRCVNPFHLAPMTNAENVLAGNRARGVTPTETSLRQMVRRKARGR